MVTCKTKINIPDGVYDGIWGGYTAYIKGYEYTPLDTHPLGIKGINCKCKIQVTDGIASILSKSQENNIE